MSEGADQRRCISQLALMRDFLIAAISRKLLGRGEAMGKGIAVDVSSHWTKEKASQKLAFPTTIVKAFRIFCAKLPWL
jgi:hypothetical protein